MRKIVQVFAASMFVVVAMCSSVFAQSGGSVSANFLPQMPYMYEKGTVYSTPNLTFAGTAPSTATMTIVAWTWGFISTETAPAGLIVQLCNTDPNVGTCLDISNSPHGTTTLWQGAELTSGAMFQIKMEVPGNGVITPTLYPSLSDQVIVNYVDAN